MIMNDFKNDLFNKMKNQMDELRMGLMKEIDLLKEIRVVKNNEANNTYSGK